MTDEQKASIKLKHYTLHIPATALPEQIEFIQDMAKNVLDNKPIVVIHEKTMQFLLRLAVEYRNVLFEFDEEDRWTDDDDRKINVIMLKFKPILEWLQEQYKLDIGKRFRK